MATQAQIREGLRARLATIAGWIVSAYVPGSPSSPGMYVMPGAIAYDIAGSRGADELIFAIVAYAAVVEAQGAQLKLDQARAPSGAGSVKAAVEGDRTLGGVVDNCRVASASEVQTGLFPGTQSQVVFCTFEVRILD